MFTVDSRVSSCSLRYMNVKQVQQQQAAIRAELATAGLQHDDATKRLTECRAVLRVLAARGIALGLTEVEVARLAGVARSSVRDWLGKRT